MKAVLLAAALLFVGTQAQATWAEGPNQENTNFTGTNRSLAKSQGYYYRHQIRRYRQW